MSVTQSTPDAPAVTMLEARLAFECLLEQERDVFALLSAIRDRDNGSDLTTTRLLEMAWLRAGENEHQKTAGEYFGVDIYAKYERKEHDDDGQ
ncbi:MULTISPECIES: hypothetical protein [Diaphorobacter]|uniref:hypothetical protein n=1 Tax=Diaphorobacter TaxID=238749 RepID=UPI0000DC9861|nr:MULTISPECIES: hypothetical protein [Diaphorobacter]ABM41181.1 hypothetical protein Ajs_0941 [Acidovorax sp. JS42]POR12153.1 hypothetical protein BV908_04585 [Diaphorobacter sp. LR2014-1]QPN30508.1 hypothetical protein I3K84_17205 [Diaphorobacter sp. JS3051]TFI47897.1 hypothetical protein E4O93_10225 [Diaphorobacter sp. DS2]